MHHRAHAFGASLAAAAVPLLVALATPVAARAAADPAFVVFDCRYSNFAWRRVVTGTLVDSDGRVLHYDLSNRPIGTSGSPREDETSPIVENGHTYLSPQQMEAARQRPENRHVKTLDPAVVKEKTALLTKAAAGKITRKDDGVRDAGTSACYGYLPDGKGRYEQVALGSIGQYNDMRTTNATEVARQLLDWLQSGALK